MQNTEQESIEAIRQAVKLGVESIDEIVEEVGITEGTIRGHASIRDIKLPQTLWQINLAKTKQEICDYARTAPYNGKWTLETVGKKYNFNTLSKYILL